MTDEARKAEQQRLAQLAHLEYIRRAATARATRMGPGPDRPRVHGVIASAHC